MFIEHLQEMNVLTALYQAGPFGYGLEGGNEVR